MLHMTKRIATESSHIGQTVAQGWVDGAGLDWVEQRFAVRRGLLELLELNLLAAADGCSWD